MVTNFAIEMDAESDTITLFGVIYSLDGFRSLGETLIDAHPVAVTHCGELLRRAAREARLHDALGDLFRAWHAQFEGELDGTPEAQKALAALMS